MFDITTILTICVKSMRYVSYPPNKTAWVGLTQVSVKPALGEGLVPVIKGVDHVPNYK